MTAWLSFGVSVGASFVAWGHGAWMALLVVPLVGLAASVVQIRRANDTLNAHGRMTAPTGADRRPRAP